MELPKNKTEVAGFDSPHFAKEEGTQIREQFSGRFHSHRACSTPVMGGSNNNFHLMTLLFFPTISSKNAYSKKRPMRAKRKRSEC